MKLHLPLLAVAAACVCAATRAQPSGALADAFQNPPDEAKPRVWWHWVDGDVSKEGVALDLAWLKEIGVGGVQHFDASVAGLFGAPRAPAATREDRLIYLSPEWRETFRFAVRRATELGLEFTIAASPGWSESGGPWVKPQQAMKKLVWSETLVEGGARFKGTLASPPRTTGPFQNIPFVQEFVRTEFSAPEYYADAAVVAFPAGASAVSMRALHPTVTSSSGPLDPARLWDGDLAQAVPLRCDKAATSWIRVSFSKPQTIRALTTLVRRPAPESPFDVATGGAVWLEAEGAQGFAKITDVPRDGALEQTVAFAPVTARVFRLMLARPANADVEAPCHEIAELVLHTAPRVLRFEDKAGFSARAIEPRDDTPSGELREAIDQNSVIDLADHLRADGTLDWTAPRGRWVVLRLGYSLTGRTNHPASRAGTGLEVDKLNRGHVKAYLDAYLGALGPDLLGKKGVAYMLTDSYEAGAANWTDDILMQFRARRGYDPMPWLPVLTGRIVASADASDRFLHDFRATLADLLADAHYAQLSVSLHERGMGRYGESHEAGRVLIGDGMQMKKSADVPMGAIWTSPWGPPRESFDADIRESASVAHLYGQNLVAAESFTAFDQPFGYSPEMLKPIADRALAMGLNRFVIHTSVHQPDSRSGPGVTLGPFGQWFTRHETWAPDAEPWISYLTRSAYLLQQGRFVADVAYLYGEDNNITNLFAVHPPAIPAGYNFDYLNNDALLNVIEAKNGGLVTPSGMRYAVLALDPSTRRMSLAVLRKIRDLVEQGAAVVGARPERSTGLADDEAEFQAIVARLWGSAANAPHSRIFADVDVAKALALLSVPPDCELGNAARDELRYVHRAIEDGDIYFIASASSAARRVEASFRVTGRAPELWRADSGAIAAAPYRVVADRTIVPLNLTPHDAVFVVFREPARATERVVPEPIVAKIAEVQGPWRLQFPPDRGAPAELQLNALSSWTDLPEPGVRYFSGTATYTTTVQVNATWLQRRARIQIDLGTVKNLAEVTVNERSIGVLWKAPFVADITEALHAGANRLTIRVTNLWPNRLIGDRQPGARPIASTTYNPYEATSPLLPSGLLGPVTLSRVTTH